ncbi:uncharacterized protein [Mytilus edulis]|uniref:uncharacterized protein n=1 Tax=Mytilus edulis TaxID=6550 RepID=UPI0039EF4390
MAILPTGFGKLLPYQMLVSVRRELEKETSSDDVGKVIVCSPLVALMADQVNRINAVPNVTAAHRGACSNGDDDILKGKFDYLFASPETLISDKKWRMTLQQMNVSLIVEDEFHTICTYFFSIGYKVLYICVFFLQGWCWLTGGRDCIQKVVSTHWRTAFYVYNSKSRIADHFGNIRIGIGNFNCILYAAPSSVVDLIQEVGRIGRNGDEAVALLLFNKYHLQQMESRVKRIYKAKMCVRLSIMEDFLTKTELAMVHSGTHTCCDICEKECTCGECNKVMIEQFFME